MGCNCGKTATNDATLNTDKNPKEEILPVKEASTVNQYNQGS